MPLETPKVKTQIDFYILTDNPSEVAKSNPLMISCLLIEKAYHLNHKIFVLTEDKEQSRQIDDLLWKFKQNAFIPHSLELNSDDPVIIGEQLIKTYPIIINLANKIINLDQYEHIDRILEIIANSAKSLGRKKYKDYQTNQEKYSLELKVHQL